MYSGILAIIVIYVLGIFINITYNVVLGLVLKSRKFRTSNKEPPKPKMSILKKLRNLFICKNSSIRSSCCQKQTLILNCKSCSKMLEVRIVEEWSISRV